jgi:hypothetical protein
MTGQPSAPEGKPEEAGSGAGPGAAGDQELGAIARPGVALRIVGVAGGVRLVSRDVPDPSFVLPDGLLPGLIEVLEGVQRAPFRPADVLEREDIAVIPDERTGASYYVDVVRGDGVAIVYLGPVGRGAVRIDQRDLPEFVAMLRRGGTRAATHDPRTSQPPGGAA